jgi:uncharacterized membrane protein YesL
MIAWCLALNALWLGLTLLGGVVLGVGPATVTACILTRRRMRGETIQIRDFLATWRREFLAGNVVLLPVAVVVLMLWSNYAFFSGLGSGASAARLVTLAAFVLTVGAGAYVGPMYAHYRLPLRSYAGKALRVALARPASTVILLAVFATLAFVTAVVPVLLFTVSIGAWLQTSTWLCVRFFEENEDRLAAPAAPGPAARPAPAGLPAEPLRVR